jgi:hypothetical protein
VVDVKDTNYNIVQGDSFSLSITYTDPSGVPINLSNASALMIVADQPGGSIFCASACGFAATPANNDGITVTASAGKLDINLTPTKTRKFNLPKSAYQVQIKTSSTTSTTLLKGWFQVDAGVID